jgi:hypothetical protein
MFCRWCSQSNTSTKYIYIKITTVYMSPRRNWDSPNPSLASECASTPGNKGGGHNSLAGEGLGESQFPRLEKTLALCLLCDYTHKANIRDGRETVHFVIEYLSRDGGHRRGIILQDANPMSGVFEILTPTPSVPGECVPLAFGEWGSIVRKTPDTALYSNYVSTLWWPWTVDLKPAFA